MGGKALQGVERSGGGGPENLLSMVSYSAGIWIESGGNQNLPVLGLIEINIKYFAP